MKIVIPFPLPGLNEYIDANRGHRKNGARFKRKWQEDVIRVLKRQIRGPLNEPVVIHYLFVEKDRKRDKDNVSGFGHKVIQDALVQMYALKNDGWANISQYTDDFSVDKRSPRVEIEIEEAK